LKKDDTESLKNKEKKTQEGEKMSQQMNNFSYEKQKSQNAIIISTKCSEATEQHLHL
jgi:hypothetical protein